MTTIVANDVVFLHAPGTSGTQITLALAKERLIQYDYRYDITYPHKRGLFYDTDCNLVRRNGEPIPTPPLSQPYATMNELRPEDRDKPCILTVKQPHSWYITIWEHKNEFPREHAEVDDFIEWMEEKVLLGSKIGLCTRYFRMYGSHNAKILRSEFLSEDWRNILRQYSLSHVADLLKPADQPEIIIPERTLDKLMVLDREIYEKYLF